MEQIPFGPKPKVVDLTSDRKLADKVHPHFYPTPALLLWFVMCMTDTSLMANTLHVGRCLPARCMQQ